MRYLLLVPFALTMLACAPRSPASQADPREAAFVEVENQGFYDVTIYILRSGVRTRLGNVPGNSTKVFEIPRTFVNPGIPIAFMADPIGSGRTPYSQEIPVFPGQTIGLRIPPF